jgi:hypothetical protein
MTTLGRRFYGKSSSSSPENAVILREVAGSMDMLFSFFPLLENDNGLTVFFIVPAIVHKMTGEATTRGIPP